jgi:hypothetical protein
MVDGKRKKVIIGLKMNNMNKERKSRLEELYIRYFNEIEC